MSKKKVILSTIAILIVMFAAVSVVSYSIANLGHGDKVSEKVEQNELTNLGAGATDSGYISNIDLIIENAITKNDTFNIVEIVPGTDAPDDTAKSSGLDVYSKTTKKNDAGADETFSGFATYVLNAYKSATNTQSMPQDKIKYNLLKMNSTRALTDIYDAGDATKTDDDVTVQKLLDSADLIYISSPTYGAYDGVFNISDDMYNYLQNYAITYKKPIIIDYVTAASDGGGTSTTYGDLATAMEFNYIKYRTFPWKPETSADDFFKSKDSYYLRMVVNNLKEKASGKVLVLTTNGTDTANGSDTISDKMKAYADMITNAYHGDQSKKPDKMEYVYQDVDSDALTVDDLNTSYDFIVIENSVSAKTVSADVYKKLKNMSETNQYIIFDSRMVTSSNAGSIEIARNNYLKLLYLLVNNTGLENFTNVLAVSSSFFGNLNTLGESASADAKKVADLINKAIYRDSATSGAAGKKFRVLEIQPCYPIDLEIAESNPNDSNGGYTKKADSLIQGSYYTYPDQVLYGYSKDEVPEGKEYYAFEISKAKISHATGIAYNQIEVEQMSTNQLISTKKVILENYDLVYIGGDTSALVPHTSVNYGGDANYTWERWGADRGANAFQGEHDRAMRAFTAFDMYTHTGNFIDYNLTFNKIGTDTNSITTNGNDLTTIKRDELKNYVDAGLPLLVDKVVQEAFEESYQYDSDNKASKNPNRLKQLELHDIDPDSNMYQFLAYTYEKVQAGTANNVAWGTIDTKTAETQIDNSERNLGNTIGPNVTVYDEATSAIIKAKVDSSNKRPSLVVSDYPTNYVEGSNALVYKNQTIPFEVSVKDNDDTSTTAKTYNIELYVDANGDGMYSESEKKGGPITTVAGVPQKLSFQVDADFFGLINWQIKATEVGTVMCDTVTGNAFCKVADNQKKTVRVLQIMPYKEDDPNNEKFLGKEQIVADKHYIQEYSLYFCTECQQASKIIKNNVTIDSRDFSQTINGKTYYDLGQTSKVDGDSAYDVNVGLHEHDFGIVPYDSTLTRYDDWEANIADTLTHGKGTLKEASADAQIMAKLSHLNNYISENTVIEAEAFGEYEFDLDIMTDDEFNLICDNALDRTETTMSNAKTLAETNKTLYEKAQQDLTKLEGALIEDLFNVASELNALSASDKSKICFIDFIIDGIGTKDAPGPWIIDKEYYKFWEYFNEKANTDDGFFGEGGEDGARPNVPSYTRLKKSYTDYIDGIDDDPSTEALDPLYGYNDMVTFKEAYKTNIRQTTDKDNWLNENYDVIVLGLAEKFNGQDLTEAAAQQIKTYIDNDGAVLNTHETITGESDKGSFILTKTLRDTFGMDRFHVVDYSDNNTVNVDVNMNYTVASEKTIRIATKNHMQYNGFDILITNKDVKVNVKNEWNGGITYEYVGEEKKIGEPIYVTFTGVECTQEGGLVYQDTSAGIDTTAIKYSNGAYETLTIEAPVAYETDVTSGSFVIGKNNVNVNVDVATHKFEASPASSAVAADGSLAVVVNVNDGANKVVDGIDVVWEYKGVENTAKTADGKVSFIIDPKQAAGKSIFDVPTGCNYRIYPTEDSTKYFWTERLQAASEADYQSVIDANRVSTYVHYNAPVGLTDQFAIYNAMDIGLGPYKYIFLHKEAFDHVSDVDGINYEAKYGTRKTEQVNKGGVTFFPFVIAEEMLISPTHSQVFALDLEDPTVAVWYTMGSNYIDSSIGVDQGFAKYSSVLFAASPRDGMSNYYLYSKDNVFYTGAGHQRVTGRNKNNNDERRLFINVIVNCVTKGVVGPTLKLYNVCTGTCTEKSHPDDCKYVDPTNAKENTKLSKQLNTLYYNSSINMYQYNIDESQTTIYPEFDFKAIAGTGNIKKIDVFYDLDYDSDPSNKYTNDSQKHILIDSYDQSDQMNGKREKLRQTTQPGLLLDDEYFKNYNDKHTYIVVHVTDTKGKESYARIKINKIPHLFDLTDAGSEAVNSSFDSLLLDMSDRKFNI